MRIYGATGMNATATSSAAKRPRTSGFTLPQAEPELAPSQTGNVRSLAGIDALLALQGVDDPAERRRRSVSRGRAALDVLEDLKLAVLEGKLDSGTVARLKIAATGLKDSSGDRNLDAVLAEIELRVEVELAKFGSQATI